MSSAQALNTNTLAIAGGTPTFKRPLHVGQPNVGSREVFDSYVDRIFDAKWLTNSGPLVLELESRIAEYLGVRECVAMANGTVALEIAVRALGMNGQVVVPSYTFVATAHSLSWQAIEPVFADIDPTTHTLDPDSVSRMITSRTTGIIGVHLWGRPANVDALEAIAKNHGLHLLFDAAHAFGASHNGRRVGNFGDAEVLSFHATKFFNTFEGGAVVTNNRDLADKMRLMRNFGFAGYDRVIHPGTNAKMSEVHAAMGLTNFEVLEDVVAANRRNREAYIRALDGIAGIRLIPFDDVQDCNFQYVVCEVDPDCPATRDQVLEALQAENVLARRYFWPGCHLMQPYRDLFPNAGVLLPHTQDVAERVLVLPTGTGISPVEISTIGALMGSIVQYYAQANRAS